MRYPRGQNAMRYSHVAQMTRLSDLALNASLNASRSMRRDGEHKAVKSKERVNWNVQRVVQSISHGAPER